MALVDEDEPPAACTLLCSIWQISLPYLVTVFVLVFHSHIPQYAIRTYVACPIMPNSTNDPSSKEWSGKKKYNVINFTSFLSENDANPSMYLEVRRCATTSASSSRRRLFGTPC